MKALNLRLIIMISLIAALSTVPLIAQPPAKPGPTPVKKNPLDKGAFKVGFSPKTKAHTPNKEMPKEEADAFKEIADSLNSFIALPRDIYLNMDTCGEPNAFYNSETSEITMCYEYLADFERDFKTITKDPKELDDMVGDAFVQIMFHELGHCLIDVWDLPATGREEDAVDQLAMVLMLDGSNEGAKSAINAAIQWDLASKNDDPNDMLFWDEHSFSKTRFYDMMCLVYGSNPTKFSFFVGPDKLPAQRAQRCPAEFGKANHAWMKLLDPYLMK